MKEQWLLYIYDGFDSDTEIGRISHISGRIPQVKHILEWQLSALSVGHICIKKGTYDSAVPAYTGSPRHKMRTCISFPGLKIS